MLMSGLWNTCVWMLFASTLSFCSAKGSAPYKSYPLWWLYSALPSLTVRAVNGSRLSADRTFLSASTVPHQKLRKFHEAEWSEWTVFHLWSTVKGLHSKVKTLHKAGSLLSFQWAWSTPDYFIGHNWTQVLTVVKGEWQTLTHAGYNAFQKCKAEWWHSSTKSKKKHGKLLMTQFATLLHSWVSRTKLAALKHSKVSLTQVATPVRFYYSFVDQKENPHSKS